MKFKQIDFVRFDFVPFVYDTDFGLRHSFMSQKDFQRKTETSHQTKDMPTNNNTGNGNRFVRGISVLSALT